LKLRSSILDIEGFIFCLMGGGIMRVAVTMACTTCKQRNYITNKNKKTNPDRMELKKFCKHCNEHILHRETR
jgi:large subunit ribosomal protein L33